MADSNKFCQTCGQPLSPGVRFCEDCGAKVPADAGPAEAAPGLPYTESAPSRRLPGWALWAAGAGGLMILCCLLVGGAALLFPDLRQRVGFGPAAASEAAASPVPSLPPVVENTALVISPAVPPTATEAAALEPTQAPPTPRPTARTEQVFEDDFSNMSSGWPQLDDNIRLTGYSEGAMYGIALKQPGGDADIRVPHGFDLPLSEVELYYRARPVGGKGYFGAGCDYQDEDNYIFIGIAQGAYTIAKNENGTFTSFFDPFWVQDAAVAAENGEFQVLIQCGGGKIQLMINGYSPPAVENVGLTGGDVLIMVSANKNAVLDGNFYYEVLIDDVRLVAR